MPYEVSEPDRLNPCTGCAQCSTKRARRHCRCCQMPALAAWGEQPLLSSAELRCASPFPQLVCCLLWLAWSATIHEATQECYRVSAGKSKWPHRAKNK